MEQENKNTTEAPETEKTPFSEHLAMEMLRNERDKRKAKNLGIVGLTVAVIVIAIGMAIINYKNDVDWRKLFSDYDFISQDGDGINNVNKGEQGDLNNGAASENEEEWEIERNGG